MIRSILAAFSLLDFSGHLIIAGILACLLGGITANTLIRIRYASIARDLRDHAEQKFSHAVLNSIVRASRLALARTRELNAQAIVEQQFQAELKPLLIGERFVRSATGLMIILGLVGTFYGLTLSIGKLVTLVAGNSSAVPDLTRTITQGLTQALAGMSVAFTTSLFGIVAAIVMMVLGIVSNITDQRNALMVQIENYLERTLRTQPAVPEVSQSPIAAASEKLDRMLQGFGQSVAALDAAVARFDGALQTFASNTRDFREFNLHLKDNVQRMSLSFGDFSEALRAQVSALRSGRDS